MSQRVIGGRFRLTAELGSGAFGRVWSAFDEKLCVEVAIKQVRIDSAASSTERAAAVTQAENEARSAARLREHPNIVAVYDVVTEAGSPWLVMRLVRGKTLVQVIAQGRLDPREAGKVAAGVLAALSAAHGAGIVHRDVKPANIMLAGDGTVLLTDFGIAKQHTNTTQAVLMGTLPYMSPERLNGKDLPAGDLFALGATIYEMTEGTSPFARATPTAIMSAVATEQPAPPSHAGPVAPLILALLEKDPAKRPSATAAQALVPGQSPGSTVQATIPVPASPGSDTLPTAEQWPHDPRRVGRRGVIAAGVAVAAVAAVPAAVALWPSGKATSNAGGGHPTAAPTRPQPLVNWQGPVTMSDRGSGTPKAVAFSPSGTLAAGADSDGTVWLWDTTTWSTTKSFVHHAVDPFSNLTLDLVVKFDSAFGAALCPAFSPDGSVVAVGNGDGTTSLWNIANGAETVLPYVDPVEWNYSNSWVAFAPNGRILATTYDAPAVRLWNLTTRTSLATLNTGDTSWIGQMAFSPTGGILATASGNGNPGNTVTDGRLQIWDTSSYTLIATLSDTNSLGPQPLAFSPDGKTLANLRSDGKVTLWDVASRTPTSTLAGSGSGVTSIAYSSRGVLAGGIADGTVTLWDAASGKSLSVLATGTNDTVSYVAFSPNGNIIMVGTTNAIAVWKSTA
ncbi:hypothetical protein ABIA31_009376 [Catenulispora sp. MAP5-51]|uniref:WD40 repeat domain-containing serine/threonine protein kinase n=1 Tax=Catenulispora sp. MAP5-51 TaxID=3156298 RepID=UPI003511CD7B